MTKHDILLLFMPTPTGLTLTVLRVDLKILNTFDIPGPQSMHQVLVHMIGRVIRVAACGIGFMNQLSMPPVLNIMARSDFSTLGAEAATAILVNQVGRMQLLTVPIIRLRRHPLPLLLLLQRVMFVALFSR